VYRFHARDLHLVMGPGKDNKPVRFRVSIDGAALATHTVRMSWRTAPARSRSSACISSCARLAM